VDAIDGACAGNTMNRIRPIAGVLLATLLFSPVFPAALTTVFAAEVELLPPGGGLDLPPKEDASLAGGTELAPPTGRETVPASSGGNGSSSDLVDMQPTLQTRHFGLNVELSCAVSGQPNAIVVVNRSAEALPPGTRIKWQLKSEGKRGYFALLSPLAGGDTLVADNVLDGDADKSAACVARVI